MAPDLTSKLRDHLAQTALIPDGAPTLVAYSGGPDSTCLLHALCGLGLPVIAAHLHHGLRPEADSEADLAEAFCAELGVPFLGGKAEIARIARDFRIGLEEAGRRARQEFLERACRELRCGQIATGHTRDDLVETVLFHLTRGTGLHGLGGIRAARPPYVRPLLPFDRAETRAHCEAHGLWTVDDPANSDLAFARARIRHRVLPELAQINENVREAVARTASLADREDRFLDAMAAAALEPAERPLNGPLRFLTLDCEVALDAQALRALPPVLLARGVRLVAGALGASLDYALTDQTVAGVVGGGTGSLTASDGGVRLTWNPDRLTAELSRPDVPFRHPLTLPGETVSEEFGWAFTAREAPPVAGSDRTCLVVTLDVRAVKGPLHFRTFQDGDRIDPLGLGGRRKIGDMFTDRKLTEAARRRLPIVCDLVGPVWVPGVCLGDRVKVTDATTRAVTLTFGPATELATQAEVDTRAGSGPGGP